MTRYTYHRWRICPPPVLHTKHRMAVWVCGCGARMGGYEYNTSPRYASWRWVWQRARQHAQARRRGEG